MSTSIVFLLICISSTCVDSKSDGFREHHVESLSNLLKANKIDEARESALVTNLPNAPNITSYAGYIQINQTTDSNLFFWFFPSEKPNVPVGIWLQGGPGAPSVFGLFTENGPFKVMPDMTVTLRNYSWTEMFSLLYIDQPVGTGFSYTEQGGYVESQEEVGRDLYNFLVQFYKMFPEQLDNDLYLTGESYAGRYVPALAYKLHQTRSSSNIKLKGLAIGDGYVDGGIMNFYADQLYQIGVFDDREAEYGRKVEKQIVELARQQKWRECFTVVNNYINDFRVNSTFFNNVTGCKNYENFLRVDYDYDPFTDYLARDDVKRAIHVGSHSMSDGNKVLDHLLEDNCKSVKPWLEELIDAGYDVLLYSGQLDIIVSATNTRILINNMNWKNAENYRNSPKKIWKIDERGTDIAGYVQSYKNFYYAIVRGAGHMVPTDQPERCFDLIKRFVNRKL